MNEHSDETHKIRARLIVIGDAQGVAYRAQVKSIAGMLRIKGIAKNLEDGRVEIFCECDELTLKKFIKAITLKREDENILSPNVDNIKVYRENQKKYNDGIPPKEFRSFYVDYGEGLTSYEKESLTKLDTGSLLLGDSSKKIAIVGQKVDKMSDVIVDRFDKVEQKYHSFGKDLKDIKVCFQLLTKAYLAQQKTKK